MTSKNLKNFEFRLGRQGIILFVVGISLFLFFVFIIGVMVGMHIDAYPEKIARVMPHLIHKQIERFLAKTEKAPPEVEDVGSRPQREESHPPVAVIESFSPKAEEAKNTAGMEEKKAPLVSSQPSGSTVDAATGNNSSLAITGGGSAKPPPAAASEEEKENRLLSHDLTGTSGKRKTTAGGKYMLRVVSFKSRKKAERFSEKLTSLGYNPYVAMVELPKKGEWFRVVIDGFETKGEAKKAAGVLSEKIKGVNCVISPIK